jgi:DNA (cytosine-5)-methyltransferase 1
MKEVKVIDIFAGPGGLGEGFHSFRKNVQKPTFSIGLSIEMDYFAHKTLLLRSFFRQFNNVPDEYYDFLKGQIIWDDLFKIYPKEFKAAQNEAWQATLGDVNNNEIDIKIDSALQNEKKWVLVGGPPCQAYSVVGRSRNKGIKPNDHRLYLYKEYLRIIAKHNPPFFIMENVKGLLSASVENKSIFEQMRSDFKHPALIFDDINNNSNYTIYPLTANEYHKDLAGEYLLNPTDFIIKSEQYGIPQKRHRVILLGIRDDLNLTAEDIEPITKQDEIPISNIIDDLPIRRSGISKGIDDRVTWDDILRSISNASWYKQLSYTDSKLFRFMANKLSAKNLPGYRGVGNLSYAPSVGKKIAHSNWFYDKKLTGVSNHDTRAHIKLDLHRYFFYSCFGKVYCTSPTIDKLPEELLPKHKNVKSGKFKDRFKVQLSNSASATITSHISKDGHYYIHPDPKQCRSLTVREAARIQTFPDNFFFCGPRTEQYKQVGNAVPPFLAFQIARVVYKLLKKI